MVVPRGKIGKSNIVPIVAHYNLKIVSHIQEESVAQLLQQRSRDNHFRKDARPYVTLLLLPRNLNFLRMHVVVAYLNGSEGPKMEIEVPHT